MESPIADGITECKIKMFGEYLENEMKKEIDLQTRGQIEFVSTNFPPGLVKIH